MPPPPDSLTRLALRAMREVQWRAHQGLVELTLAERVTLEWLVRAGVAQRWQVREFIEFAASSIDFPAHSNGEHNHYIRSTIVDGCLRTWHYNAGIVEPDSIQLDVVMRRHAVEMLDPDDGQPQPWHMCNRYRPGDREKIMNILGAKAFKALNDGPSIVHPRDPGFVVRLHKGELVLDQMTWGFPVILHGKRGQPLKPKPVNNARFDKLDKFWLQWAREPTQRCLIPATAYAEAVGPSGSMLTTWLALKSTPMFAWAGLWANHNEWGPVYTGVMTDNAPELANIHDRSPVILAPEDWETWLTAPLADLRQFDRQWPADDVLVKETSVLWTKGGSDESYRDQTQEMPWSRDDSGNL